MDRRIEDVSISQSHSGILVSSLYSLLAPNQDVQELINGVVKEIHRISGCGHVLMSRYVSATKTFEPVSWESTITPSKVSLGQKFMGEMYLDERLVKIDDLSPHNYRLRPDVARLGLMSMVGIPMIGQKGLIGVVECCSNKLSHFSDEMVDNLVILARQAVLIMERIEQEKLCKRLYIENEFMHEIQNSDKSSDGMLLYRLGEALVSLIEPDGIAIFGVELQTEDSVLQEVMANCFSMKDIYLLKKVIKNDLLDKMLKTCGSGDIPVYKQSLSLVQDKVLNMIPVCWQSRMQGIVVYYSANDTWHTDTVGIEQSVKRVIRYTAITLQRNNTYNSIQRISFIDQLTGIGNRRLFDYMFDRDFNKFKHSNNPWSLVLIDIDHFKTINDRYGHQAGDAILRQIANMLKREFGSRNTPARYGGEEFVVILPNITLNKALDLADGFRRKIEETNFVTGNEHVRITVSIGVAAHNGPRGCLFIDTDSFISASDRALYQAKQQGRNQVVASISRL